MLHHFSWFILGLTWGNEVLMHCGIDVWDWPEILLCNGPVSGGGWGGVGSHWGKSPCLDCPPCEHFCPYIHKRLYKKERERREGVSVDEFAWLNHFKHLPATLVAHTSRSTHCTSLLYRRVHSTPERIHSSVHLCCSSQWMEISIWEDHLGLLI